MRKGGDGVQPSRGAGVDAELKQLVRQALVGGPVNVGTEVAAVPNLLLTRKHDLKHRADALHNGFHASRLKDLSYSRAELLSDLPHVAEARAVFAIELAKTGTRSMQANAGGVMRAIVQNSTPRERLHDLTAAHQRCYWQPAPERFSERGEVGGKFVVFLTAPAGNAKACNGLVENEQGPMFFHQFLESVKVTVCGRNHAHVRHHAFGDHGRDLPAMVLQGSLQQRKIVPRHDHRVLKRVEVQS